MSTKVRVHTLGDFSIRDSKNCDVHLPTRKCRALFVYLALNAGKRFPRGHLASLLWSNQGDRLARQSLRQALFAIRSSIGDSIISTDSEYAAIADSEISTDAHDFELLARSKTSGAAERATNLYRGALLVDHETSQPTFDDWLFFERERLKNLARDVFGRMLAIRSQNNDFSNAIALANSLISIDPFDEEVRRKLMHFHVRQGRPSSAIQHYRDFSAMLRREIGVSPEIATVSLYNELCRDRMASPALSTLQDYTFVLEQMAQCVVVTDLTSRIVGWNKAAEVELGFSKEYMLGQKPTLAYAPKRDQSLSDKLFELACERGHWTGKVKLLCKDGNIRIQNRIVTPLYDRSGTLIGAFGLGVPS